MPRSRMNWRRKKVYGCFVCKLISSRPPTLEKSKKVKSNWKKTQMGNLPFEIVQSVLIQVGKKADIFYGIWAFFINVWLSGFKSLESFLQTLSTFAFKMVPWPLKWNKVKRLVPLLNRIQNSAGDHRLPVDFIINFLSYVKEIGREFKLRRLPLINK